jgi:hypothetical protein
MGVELEEGEPRFYVRINLATMGNSEEDAVQSMRIAIRSNLSALADSVERACTDKLAKLNGIYPCSEFTPRVYLSAFKFNSESCLGDKW